MSFGENYNLQAFRKLPFQNARKSHHNAPTLYIFIISFIHHSLIWSPLFFLLQGCWVWICWCKEKNSWINVFEEISCSRRSHPIRKGLYCYYYCRIVDELVAFHVVGVLKRSDPTFLQRRRDRINEKIRALQELIPRCNKVLSSCWRTIFMLSHFTSFICHL